MENENRSRIEQNAAQNQGVKRSAETEFMVFDIFSVSCALFIEMNYALD